MSLFAQAPSQPTLTWQFESSNVDSVTGLAPAFSSTNTATAFLPTYPTGIYNLGMRLNNPTVTTGNTWVRYTFTNSIPADSGVTLMCWVKYNTLGATTTTPVTLYDQAVPTYSNTLSLGMTTTNVRGYSSLNGGYSSTLYPNAITGTYTTGVWYHLAVTFTSSTIVPYFNGVAGTSKATGTTGISFTAMRLGSYTNGLNNNSGFNSADCTIDDLRVYNTALTASQIQAIYQAQGMPNKGNVFGSTAKTYLTGQSLSSQLSVPAIGIFSLRAVNGTTVKAVQVKRQSDNVTQDFWADRLGNLLTVPVTGTLIVDWLGGSTGNVVSWYDQSGQGNHVNQPTAANQPTLNLSNATVSFNGNQWLSNTSSTGFFIPLYQNAYSIVTKHRQWTVGAAWSTGNTVSLANSTFNGLRWAAGNYYQNYRGGGFLQFGPQPGTFPVVATVVNDRTNDIGYINGVQSATTTTVNPNVDPAYAQFIGYDANSASNRMQGELHAVMTFSSALSTADRTIIESLI